MRSRYKDLVAFQLSAALADDLHRAVRGWQGSEQRALGDQLTRSADSIGANIAEGAGRWTKAERRRFLITARGSLYETEYWIDRAKARGLGLPDSIADLDRIAHTLSGLIRRHS